MKDCSWRNRFNSSKSSSYKKDGKDFNVSLSAVADVAGFIGIDTVTLGDYNGLTVRSQTFGQVTNALFDYYQAYDGVLGIGSPSFAVQGITPLLDNAKQQGAIQKNVVTVALIREGIQSPDLPGGSITYGGVDTKYCGPNVTYIRPLDKVPSIVSLDRVSFGGFEAPRPAGTEWRAGLSFANTALTGSTKVINGLAKAAGALEDGNGAYFIPCNAELPSLFLTLNGQRFEIPGSELVQAELAVDPNLCIFNVYASDMYPGLFS
ncbi:aspartic protease, partial [Aphelenchoides avenae]